ncbi:hypothetical protein CAPTEDRAFT_196093 [Capitella teleta]|uniref:Reverse transcriptase domain-containing protein n=1 Tax=Capitella teleta TaxID=283909 RepID=R7U0M2_CAPTE|nr:hypothetical protein CAPTEDRAFT_196093 [Capitella teleta]|eukprot:ELT97206.1 hypothetical protein CAPTEDRAFT_196093 [Capitella teleta]
MIADVLSKCDPREDREFKSMKELVTTMVEEMKEMRKTNKRVVRALDKMKRDLSFAIKELVGCKWKDGNFYEATVVDIRRSQYIKSFLHHSLKKSFKDRIKIRYIEDGIVETVSVDKRTFKTSILETCPVNCHANTDDIIEKKSPVKVEVDEEMEEDGADANTDEGETRSIIDKVDVTADVKSIKRLGTKEKNKNGPILVIVSSMEVRNRIAHAARNSNSRATGNVSIKRDAHPVVRVEWKRLFSVKEAEESKPENADRNITIDTMKRQVLCDGQERKSENDDEKFILIGDLNARFGNERTAFIEGKKFPVPTHYAPSLDPATSTNVNARYAIGSLRDSFVLLNGLCSVLSVAGTYRAVSGQSRGTRQTINTARSNNVSLHQRRMIKMSQIDPQLAADALNTTSPPDLTLDDTDTIVDEVNNMLYNIASNARIPTSPAAQRTDADKASRITTWKRMHRASNITLRLWIDYAKHKKKKLYLVFVDFFKAYDRVPRLLLLQRILALGCGTTMIRTLAVIYKTTKMILRSATITASAGVRVRQGSPTSRLLFTLLVNDMIRNLKEKCQPDEYLEWMHVLMLMDNTDANLKNTINDRTIFKKDVPRYQVRSFYRKEPRNAPFKVKEKPSQKKTPEKFMDERSDLTDDPLMFTLEKCRRANTPCIRYIRSLDQHEYDHENQILKEKARTSTRTKYRTYCNLMNPELKTRDFFQPCRY